MRKLIQKIRKLLKQSEFLVGIVRAARAGLLDIKKIYGFMTRRRKIRSYLYNNNQLKKLQLGTSNSPIIGWLNTDVLPTNRRVAYLDATRRFPFNDDIFDYVYSEHMIEHIEQLRGEFAIPNTIR